MEQEYRIFHNVDVVMRILKRTALSSLLSEIYEGTDKTSLQF